MYGTGLAGSLTYSSNDVLLSSEGGSNESRPPACKYSDFSVVFFGGQASKWRHWFVPVSKTFASAKLNFFAASPLDCRLVFLRVFEIVLEKRQLEMLAEIQRSLGVERHIAEPVAVGPRPPAVRPGSHHEHVRDARVQAFGFAVGLERAVQIFGIEPPAHGHDGRVNLLQMRTIGASFPPLVVIGMGHDVVPERDLVLEILLVRVRQRAQTEKELVGVGRFEIERLGFLALGIVQLLLETMQEAKELFIEPRFEPILIFP